MEIKNIVVEGFNKLVEELLAEEGAFQISLFPTEDYISYDNLERYFDEYYFKTGKSLPIPDPDDDNGWETLKYIREIESNIPSSDGFYRDFARVMVFYNTHVVEQWLLDNALKAGHIFTPNIDRDDDPGYRHLPSHEFLRKGFGDDTPDFSWDHKGRKITSDLKWITRNNVKKDIINWPAHGADYVIGYNQLVNTITLYSRVGPVPSSGNKAADYKKTERTLTLDNALLSKLIPAKVLMDCQKENWASIFAKRNIKGN